MELLMVLSLLLIELAKYILHTSTQLLCTYSSMMWFWDLEGNTCKMMASLFTILLTQQHGTTETRKQNKQYQQKSTPSMCNKELEERRPGTGSVQYPRLHTLLFSFTVVERLERARCATARGLRAAVPLARSSLSITVDEKRKGLRAD